MIFLKGVVYSTIIFTMPYNKDIKRGTLKKKRIQLNYILACVKIQGVVEKFKLKYLCFHWFHTWERMENMKH